jgi:hypothetical protein
MERYLIETPHTAENCLALVEEINAQGTFRISIGVAGPACTRDGP